MNLMTPFQITFSLLHRKLCKMANKRQMAMMTLEEGARLTLKRYRSRCMATDPASVRLTKLRFSNVSSKRVT